MTTEHTAIKLYTRDINVAAFALLEGAKLVGMAPAGRELVRFALELGPEQDDDVASRFAASPVARFLARRDGLLDAVRSRERPDHDRTRKTQDDPAEADDADGRRTANRGRGPSSARRRRRRAGGSSRD